MGQDIAVNMGQDIAVNMGQDIAVIAGENMSNLNCYCSESNSKLSMTNRT